MGNSRIHNSKRNVAFGLLKYTVTILFPFVIRTTLIYKLGTEYTGINSLFSSILQVLSLSELGFSTAVVFALYEPVAHNDQSRTCHLLSFFKSVYKYCGLFILCAGLLVCPFVKYLISGTYPSDINIYIVFVLLLINTSISYLICGYKSVLFSANQRDDILSKCSIISNLVVYVLQMVSLITLSNYYLYILSMLLGTILNNLFMHIYAKKMYPEIKCQGHIDTVEREKLIKSVGSLFGHQLDMVVITSADNIVISLFLGLTTLTIYNNYYYILNALLSVLIMVSNAFAGSIGNSIAIESKEKNFKNFIDFTYFIGTISAVCTILMFVLYQDFMMIWMGEGMLLNTGVVFCLCMSFYARQFRRSVITYKIAAGIWNKDALKPYVAATTNLILNIILVKIIGLYGVILSTIVSLIMIEAPWEITVFFQGYFKGGISRYLWTQLKIILKMLAIGALAVVLSKYIEVTNIFTFFLKAIISGVIVLGVFSFVSFKDSEFQYMLDKLRIHHR